MSTALTCTHTAPTFGCRACITKDRQTWAAKTFRDWLPTYKPRPCPECKGPMIVDREWYFQDGRLMISVFCPRVDSDGETICSNEQQVVIE